MRTQYMKFKRVLAFILSFVVLLPFCSCGNLKYQNMKNHLNSSVELEIVSIEEWIYNEKYKSVSIEICLAKNTDPSLEQLDNLRMALNEYLQKDGNYLDQGWQVSVLVDENTIGSEEPRRFAVYANFEQGYIPGDGEYRYDTADYLNTFWFCINMEDVSYISSLNNVANIHIGGQYNDSDLELMNKTIEEIRELNNLERLAVCDNWYDAFSAADLKCELSVTRESKVNNGVLMP